MAVEIRTGLQPGDFGTIVHLHGVHFAREYGLDTTFEPYVARTLADFVLDGAGCLWIAEAEGRVLGTIAIVHAGQNVAQLRWFLLVPEARGQGVGKRLLNEALGYCRAHQMQRVFLHTFTDLKDAIRLYQRAGFTVAEEMRNWLWGAQRIEWRMELLLSPPAT
ncbi:MAG TPA: GNAT family N-acetyltransferase [Hyphomicrobiaceae bacterium]|nr:GNAT family N-acetyltransferase [Hyphomicrobiaceae bacterium]